MEYIVSMFKENIADNRTDLRSVRESMIGNGAIKGIRLE